MNLLDRPCVQRKSWWWYLLNPFVQVPLRLRSIHGIKPDQVVDPFGAVAGNIIQIVIAQFRKYGRGDGPYVLPMSRYLIPFHWYDPGEKVRSIITRHSKRYLPL